MENRCRANEEFQEEEVWGWGAVRGREDSESWTKSDERSNVVQECRMRQQPSSAPVDIPDWSKIYGANPKKWCGWPDDDGSDGDEEGSVIPPHQLIAGKQLGSFSVFEGAGRTLKGRDLSRLRNAVLTKTGFLES